MNSQNLRELITMFDTCTNRDIKRNLAKAIRKGVIILTEDVLPSKRNYNNKLTPSEITIGKNQGKIPCIKHVRSRLGVDLITAKRMVEEEFQAKGYQFHYNV